MEKIVERYKINVDGMSVTVSIYKSDNEYVPIYRVSLPKIGTPSKILLENVRERIVRDVIKKHEKVEIKKFKELVEKVIKNEIGNISEKDLKILSITFLHEFLGLGDIDVLLQDKNIEEIVVNSSKDPVWVYHRKFAWLKTNIKIGNEEKIYNYAERIGRRVGLQITNLNPLMDAYLETGDRVNATLFPISSSGNTLTIRKFSRKAWTITDFINAKTLSIDIATFLWIAMQYEMNILIAGGTASGKTSMLNVLASFIPPTQRIISIEDTRELHLPKFLHWLPMTTRPPNPEGRGEITMLDLMVNSLRQRPDRIIVGEIRRAREAEVLFEAINTGHAVYATIHANTAEEVIRRLINKPIEIAPSLLSSLHLIVVMHRDRRRGIRRVLEIAEVIPAGTLENVKIELNTIYRWIPTKDEMIQTNPSQRTMKELEIFSGFMEEDVKMDMNKKKIILNHMVKNNINDIENVGKIISDYYMNRLRL